jgi:hypothetical protein
MHVFAYLGLGLASIATLSVPPLSTSSINNMASGTVDSDVVARDGDQGTFPLLVAERGSTLEGDLWGVNGDLVRQMIEFTVVPSFNLVKSRVVPAGTVMPLMTIAEQEALFLMAVAASVNVQLARASRLEGAAYASAPALRRKEVTCIATMMLMCYKERL